LNGSKAGERADLRGALAAGDGWLCWAGLAGIILLAAALRFAGLRWGLPNELHSYSYHPDEFLTIGSSARMAGLLDGHRTIDPGLYNYPSLYLYIATLAMMVANGYGWLGNAANVYLTARVVTVLMGLGAVGATYWAGRVMFGSAVGLLAALILAIAPLHVQHSHFATVDVPSTLFVALCLGFSGLILKRGSWRDYILAGVMAGLAGGTKYNAVLVILAPIAAHFLSSAQSSTLSNVEGRGRWAIIWRRSISGRFWLIPACAIAAFIISTPGSVLHTSQFLGGIGYEMRHQAAGHGLVFAGTGNGFVYTLTSSLHYGLSPFLTFAFVVAAIYGLIVRDRRVLTVLAFVLPYYVLISASQVRFARYALPLFPAAAILIGWLVVEWTDALSAKRLLCSVGRGIWTLLLVWALACACMLSLLYSLPFIAQAAAPMIAGEISANAFQCPQDIAARWITKYIPASSSIGLMDYPWYYSPPLSNKVTLDILPQRMEAIKHTPYRIIVFSDPANSDWWAGNRPQWIIVSDEEIIDAQRLRNATGLSPDQQAVVDRVNRDLGVIHDHYVVREAFGMGSDDMDMSVPPHDMRYIFPIITVYELKK